MANELQPSHVSGQNQKILLIIYLAIGVLSRLLPHFPNVTAMTSLSVVAGAQFSRSKALLVILLSLFISDLLLAYVFGYPVLGSWTLFTYSGFVFITLFTARFTSSGKKSALFLYLLGSSLGFWLWTNFGTWLCGGLYPHTFSAFSACYIAALPFLRNAMVGDLAWMLVILGVYLLANRSSRACLESP